MSEYWKICVAEILSDYGYQIKPEDLDGLADSLRGALDMEWEATGQYYIPDPRDTEIDNLKKQIKQEFAEAQKQTELRDNEILARYGASSTTAYVTTERGYVEACRRY